MAYQFKTITASGTFDHFHKGHEAFLRKAFEISQRVLIGITSDVFLQKRGNKAFGQLIEPFKKRKEHVVNFLKESGLLDRAEVFELDDIYGPALERKTPIEAILVTEKTREGALTVNSKRRTLGLPPLTIVTVPLVQTKSGSILSSTKLRKTLLLPKNLRPFLQKPLGTLFKGTETDLKTAVVAAKKFIEKKKPSSIITVGDVVTKSFNEYGIPIDIAIVDFRIKREEKVKSLRELGFSKNQADITVKNAPGTISNELSTMVKKAIESLASRPRTTNYEPITIRVVGEEDLAVLPAIIYAPQNCAIFYGQPQEGIVMVKVNDAVKEQTTKLLSKFKT